MRLGPFRRPGDQFVDAGIEDSPADRMGTRVGVRLTGPSNPLRSCSSKAKTVGVVAPKNGASVLKTLIEIS